MRYICLLFDKTEIKMKDKEKSFSRKLFNFFNPNKDGKGVSKDEKPLVPNLKNMPKF